jgi:hypothetical protein
MHGFVESIPLEKKKEQSGLDHIDQACESSAQK